MSDLLLIGFAIAMALLCGAVVLFFVSWITILPTIGLLFVMGVI